MGSAPGGGVAGRIDRRLFVKTGVDLVVMESRRRSGVGWFLLGCMAKAVQRDSSGDALVGASWSTSHQLRQEVDGRSTMAPTLSGEKRLASSGLTRCQCAFSSRTEPSLKVTVFSTKPYDRRFLEAANADRGHQLHFLDMRLSKESARLARGSRVVCAFVNDELGAPVLKELSELDIGLVALRSAGFNNVDLKAARALGVKVARVPAYSPHAVAEHAVALILALNRKIHRAYNRCGRATLRSTAFSAAS